jgi:HSP20 family molecular chaperone IbpA
MVTLPADVSESYAKAGFRNGILDLRLKKKAMSQKSGIPIV